MNLATMKKGEDTEQIRIFQWAEANMTRYPQLRWLFHIPNGGKRGKREAVRFKAMGVKAGVADICLPFAHGCYKGLFIEMKYGDNTLSVEQKAFLDDMEEAGHFTCVCHSAKAAMIVIEKYLLLDKNFMMTGVNIEIDYQEGKVKRDRGGIMHVY